MGAKLFFQALLKLFSGRLLQGLEGYAACKKRVRYRVIPFLR